MSYYRHCNLLTPRGESLCLSTETLADLMHPMRCMASKPSPSTLHDQPLPQSGTMSSRMLGRRSTDVRAAEKERCQREAIQAHNSHVTLVIRFARWAFASESERRRAAEAGRVAQAQVAQRQKQTEVFLTLLAASEKQSHVASSALTEHQHQHELDQQTQGPWLGLSATPPSPPEHHSHVSISPGAAGTTSKASKLSGGAPVPRPAWSCA